MNDYDDLLIFNELFVDLFRDGNYELLLDSLVSNLAANPDIKISFPITESIFELFTVEELAAVKDMDIRDYIINKLNKL